jgi:hypothetical protein
VRGATSGGRPPREQGMPEYPARHDAPADQLGAPTDLELERLIAGDADRLAGCAGARQRADARTRARASRPHPSPPRDSLRRAAGNDDVERELEMSHTCERSPERYGDAGPFRTMASPPMPIHVSLQAGHFARGGHAADAQKRRSVEEVLDPLSAVTPGLAHDALVVKLEHVEQDQGHRAVRSLPLGALLLEIIAPGGGQVGELHQTLHRVDIVFLVHIDARDVGYRQPMLVTAEQGEGLSSFHLPLVLHRHVQPRSTTRQKPFENIVPAKP